MIRQLPRYVAALAIVALGAGCGSDSAPDTGQTAADDFCASALAAVDAFTSTLDGSPTGNEGGTVVLGTTADLQGLMALTTNDYNTHQHQSFVHLMTLVRYDADLQPEPYLAESWEWNQQGTELTFHLRNDVVWHDGTPTTAQDVAFTYERAVNPETGFANAAYFQNYEGVEVLDERTVRFRLRPHAMPLDTWRATPIMPAHLLGEVPAAELHDHPYGTMCPVGNGPFRFESYRVGDAWTFAANPAFPAALGGRPSIDRYVYRVIPDPATALTELLNGDIDVYQQIRPDQGARIEGAEGLELVTFRSRDYVFVAWNTRRPVLSDASVRRAMTMAVDRDGIVDAFLGGRGVVANSGVMSLHWAYDPALAGAVPFDPDGARALLDGRGWQDRDGDGVRENEQGVPLAFSLKSNPESPLRQGIAEFMQAQLADVGVDVELISLDGGTLVQDIIDPERRFDAFILSYNTDFRVDDRDMFHSESDDSPYAFAGIRDAELDRLIDTVQTIVDEESATPLWRDYQARIVELQPYTYLFFQDRVSGLSDRVQNVRMDPRGEWSGIQEWTVPPDRRKYAASDR